MSQYDDYSDDFSGVSQHPPHYVRPHQLTEQQLRACPAGTRLLIKSLRGTVYHSTLIVCHANTFVVQHDQFGGSTNHVEERHYSDTGLRPYHPGAWWNIQNWVELQIPGLIEALRHMPRMVKEPDRVSLDWKELGF